MTGTGRMSPPRMNAWLELIITSEDVVGKVPGMVLISSAGKIVLANDLRAVRLLNIIGVSTSPTRGSPAGMGTSTGHGDCHNRSFDAVSRVGGQSLRTETWFGGLAEKW